MFSPDPVFPSRIPDPGSRVYKISIFNPKKIDKKFSKIRSGMIIQDP
jgi:hypothetical protein